MFLNENNEQQPNETENTPEINKYKFDTESEEETQPESDKETTQAQPQYIKYNKFDDTDSDNESDESDEEIYKNSNIIEVIHKENNNIYNYKLQQNTPKNKNIYIPPYFYITSYKNKIIKYRYVENPNNIKQSEEFNKLKEKIKNDNIEYYKEFIENNKECTFRECIAKGLYGEYQNHTPINEDLYNILLSYEINEKNKNIYETTKEIKKEATKKNNRNKRKNKHRKNKELEKIKVNTEINKNNILIISDDEDDTPNIREYIQEDFKPNEIIEENNILNEFTEPKEPITEIYNIKYILHDSLKNKIIRSKCYKFVVYFMERIPEFRTYKEIYIKKGFLKNYTYEKYINVEFCNNALNKKTIHLYLNNDETNISYYTEIIKRYIPEH